MWCCDRTVKVAVSLSRMAFFLPPPTHYLPQVWFSWQNIFTCLRGLRWYFYLSLSSFYLLTSQLASQPASLPALLGQACWGGPGREGWQPSHSEPSYHCHYRAGSSDTITATSRYVNMFGSDYDHFKLEHYLRLFTSVLPCPDSSVFKSKTFPTSIKFPLFKVTPKCYS